MKAIHIRQHGPAAEAKPSDIPQPSIKAGEVLVRIEAAGINPSDITSLEGRFPGSVLPRVVGRDFAGTVAEGPAELVGAKVWGSGGDLGVTRDGTHAEFVAIPARAVSWRPKNLSAEQAAAVGVPFLTAFSALIRLAEVNEGEWVIVSGAAGAVGQAAIQLAYAKGANVIALVTDASQRWVSKGAAVKAVAQTDAGDLDAIARQATGGKGADVALNGVGGSVFASLLGALGIGGRQVVYSAAGGKEAALDLLSLYRHNFKLLGLDTQKFDSVDCAGILNEIRPLFESGKIGPPEIGERYALSDAAKAYAHVASGKSGKAAFVTGKVE